MDLLIISTADLLGTEGLIVRYRELSKALGRINNKVVLIGTTYKEAHLSILSYNVHVYPIDMSFITRLKVSKRVRVLWQITWALLFYFKCLVTTVKICSSEKIDACISFTPAADPLIYLISRLFRLLWIYDVRGLSETEMPKLKMINRAIMPLLLSLDYFCSKHADKVLVVSERMKEMIVNLRNLDPSRIAISEDGVDLTAFNPSVPKGLLRDSYKVPEDDPVILYVGSISLAKGIDRVIKAMPHILEKYPNARAVIVGGGSYAVDDSNILWTMVTDMGLENNVVFTGKVKHPAPFIVDADVCVAPSSLYFSPIKIYEYLACAKPVVVAKGVDIADTLVAHNAGVVANTLDAAEFASVILLLLNDKELSQKISLNGYRLVTTNFTWDHTARKLIGVIESERRSNPIS